MDNSPLRLLEVQPLAFVLLAVSLVLALSLHEFAHAYVADLQGDRLPRAMGRVSLNPARHLDPLGTIMLFIFGFGWARPVEFRPQALSSRRFGPALVALAGPGMNIVLAAAAGLAFGPAFEASAGCGVLPVFLGVFSILNVILAVFNLLPVPPLDGSRLLTLFLPPSKHHIVFWLDRWGLLILLAFLIFNGFVLLSPIVSVISDLVLPATAGVCGFLT